MKRFFATVLGLALVAAGCSDDGNDEPEKAKALWDEIHAIDYRSLARAPGYETRKPSSGPHGGAVDVYVNDVVTKALATPGTTAWPEGSLVVKDGWEGTSLAYVAVMKKQGGAWFWAEWEGDGSTKYSGSPDVCTDCHRSGADFVRAFSLPK